MRGLEYLWSSDSVFEVLWDADYLMLIGLSRLLLRHLIFQCEIRYYLAQDGKPGIIHTLVTVLIP